jgi:hypothetical protein
MLVAQMNDFLLRTVLPAFGLDYIAGGAPAIRNSPIAASQLSGPGRWQPA